MSNLKLVYVTARPEIKPTFPKSTYRLPTEIQRYSPSQLQGFPRLSLNPTLPTVVSNLLGPFCAVVLHVIIVSNLLGPFCAVVLHIIIVSNLLGPFCAVVLHIIILAALTISL